MPARPSAHAATRLLWSMLSVVAVVFAMMANIVPANAAQSTNGGLLPTSSAQNIPANGSCGAGNAGTYVKFTTGGTSTTGGTATATGGGSSYEATYTSDQKTGLFTVTSLTTGTGDPVLFSSVVGGAQKENPVWTFPLTPAPSPALQAPADANFSQFAVCVYDTATFQVAKKVVGTTSTQLFPITYSCTINGAPAVSGTVQVAAGDTSAKILVPVGSVCTATDSAEGYDTTGAAGTITGSGSVLTVTNTRKLGDLTINKVQVGGEPITWTFHVTCANQYESVDKTVTVTGSGSTTISGLPLGIPCTVTEQDNPAAHYDVDYNDVPVTVSGSVTFTNTLRADVKVAKTENGGAPTRDYTFTLTGPDGTLTQTANAANGGALDFGYVKPGAYTLCELAVDPGMTSSLAAWKGATTSADGDVCAPLTVTAGTDLLEKIDNSRDTGALTISKTQVGGADQPWTFAVSCTGGTLGDSFSTTATVTGTGTTTIEGIPTGLTCTVTENEANQDHFVTTHSDTSVVVPYKTAATIPVVAFTNTKQAHVTLTKTEDGVAPTHAFTFTLTNATGAVVTRTTSAANAGVLDFGYVAPGTYQVCELAVPSVMQSSLAGWTGATTNAAGDVCAPVVLAAGQSLAQSVDNVRDRGQITITKAQVGGAPELWHFAVSCTGGPLEETWNGTTTVTGSGSTVVSGIPTGLTCTVTEKEFNVSPFDSTSTGTTVLVPLSGAAAAPAVTFTNTKRADVTLTKTENGAAPRFVYTFTLTGNGVSSTWSTTPGQITTKDFGLLKPGTYQLCEQLVAAGTTPTLAGMPGATTDPLTGTVCAPVTVEAGVDLALTIDNHVGEGGRRTIGYWKNWSTCGGTAGQLANAAKTGKTLLDDVLKKGVTLGGYAVPDCKTGVAILQNSSGKYAENALAAQLLAAKANVSVAGAPQSVLDAIKDADALLTSIGYKGPSSRILAGDSAARTEALRLATLLDNFNNGRLG